MNKKIKHHKQNELTWQNNLICRANKINYASQTLYYDGVKENYQKNIRRIGI